jgi:hypothetical protein
MKTRAESLDADLDKLKAAFSEISRLSAQVTFESRSAMSQQDTACSQTSHSRSGASSES